MSAEDELRELVEERVRAVAAKDATTLAARPTDDVLTYDVLPPLRSRGNAAVVEHLKQWFDGYAGPIGYTVHELEVAAAGDLGWCTFLYHVGGELVSGDTVDMWVRATLCCRRVEGRWLIVHDHESVPFDPATGLAELSLSPS